ncbi:MAG: dihydroorotase [Candidatus Peregrinibacteria bacterium]|nr:dihydroorotase [Candidatus Peregrinibacteria bacterium]MDZ4245306.1 dihydroorotase [Candidatus Gracilibacteria bacterium]
MTTLLSNVNIVTPKKTFQGHILIEDGKIAKIYKGGHEVMGEFDEEYNLEGMYVLPGVIDAHVHFRTPGHEYKEDWKTGSAAAIAGGVTTVLDMPNNNPPAISVEALDAKRSLINGKTRVNYGLYIGATPTNIEEIKKASNIAGVKIYMGSSTGDLLVDEHSVIEKIFESLPDILIAIHAESELMMKENLEKFKDSNDPSVHSKIRSCECAHIATKEAIHIGKKYGNRLHICHMSCESELDEVKKFKAAKSTEHDLRLSCEVTPHHLFLNTSDYDRLENYARMNPPLRHVTDNKALRKGLKDGSIDMIATDHAPHTKEEKERSYTEAPSGIPGVQTSLPLLLNEVNRGELNLQDVVRLMCENPARIFGIINKGVIEEGYDADLVIIDMDMEKEVKNREQFSKCGWSAFDGEKLKGWPVMTFVHGILVYDDGKVLDEFKGTEVKFAN